MHTSRPEFPPSKALKIAAGVIVVQSLMVAYELVKISNVTDINEKRARFLFDFAARNTAQLEEFDIIALSELGLIKPST